MPALTESVVESAALTWLESLGWTVKHGPDISPGGDTLSVRKARPARRWASAWPMSAWTIG
jgi:type I restriction enzyme R subunit